MSAFDNVIGFTDIKVELIRFCDVLRNMDKYKKLGVTLPRGILLYGDPGIGKTMIAKSFIEESGYKSFTVRKDKPDGDFVNEIRNTFDKAKKEPQAIVFLDDMDKFANEDEFHRDAEEYVAVQACIDECKGSGVFVLATANDRYCMPDSLTRAGRFDKVIEMKCPEGEDAKKIISYFLSKKQIIGDVDLEEISRLMEGHSCAELEAVINEAGIYAGFDRRDKVEQKDIIKACMRMIFDAPEAVDMIDTKYLRHIAVHEAGHAVISEVLDPGSVSLVSVCHYSGDSEGVTVIRRPEDYKISKKAQEHEVIRKLGGKAATEMVFGTVDMGCKNDLYKAGDLVSEFVDGLCAFGFDSTEINRPSEYLQAKRDWRISQEMARYYQQAKEIIVENRGLLDVITKELLEKKTLTYRDIKLLLNNHKYGQWNLET
ncbi:AAA family ATPase [Butyrivibrio sp. VCD2006]|uniref:AAA family ATPase n=1 Tax=Butyrivibrio sp. VCD2006 TaxID=1280664 RepID=UPI00041E069A|nr:AAA family ATPase [Butyrivibrio sp. VCD2006]